MSGMDLFEDGFPHSTREGWVRGCRGHACPGALENGFSCSEANVRWHGDYAYLKRVEAGLSPAEIAGLDRAERAVKPAKGRMLTKPTVKVSDSVESVVEKPVTADSPSATITTFAPSVAEIVAVDVVGVKPWRTTATKPGPKSTPIPHGTQAGYQRGCRDECPGDASGLTCREAASEYQREYKKRRAENGGQPLGRVVNAEEKPLRGTVTITPVVDGVVVEAEAQTLQVDDEGRITGHVVDIQTGDADFSTNLRNTVEAAGEPVIVRLPVGPVAHRARRENWVVRFARWLGVMPL